MKYYIWNYETPLGNESAVMAKTADGESLGIPKDPANTDYAAYLSWLAEGNTPEEWNPTDETPSPD